MSNEQLRNKHFRYIKLDNSNLIGLEISGSDFRDVSLENCIVESRNWLEDISGKNVKGIQELKEIYRVVSLESEFKLVKKTHD